MSPENIGLLLIIGYLGWRLFTVIGKNGAAQGLTAQLKNKRSVKRALPVPKISPKENVWNDEEFLQGAKVAFHMVCSAFAKGKKKELKVMLTDCVYDAFLKAIETREQNKQTMDFSLVCLDSAEILKKVEAAKEVTVQFISEQINILKDENGHTLEGDPMRVVKMCDTWTFRKKKNETWIVCATKSEAVNA